MSSTSRSRILGIDGLRAIAITGIVFYHLTPLAVPGGFLGVTAFFTIMGFLMVRISRNALTDGSFNALQYYKKKILRLYPSLLIVLATGLLLMLVIVPYYSKRMIGEIASIIFGYNNWWQIAVNSSYFTRIANASPFTHLWYLGLTIQYYLLWPLIGFIGVTVEKKKGRKCLLIVTAVLCAASALEMVLLYRGGDPSRIYYGTDTRAYSLLLGMLIALLPLDHLTDLMRQNKSIAWLLRAAFIASLIGIICMYCRMEGTSGSTYHGLMQLASLLFALLLIITVCDQKITGRLLEWKPLAVIGRLSYAIYLVMYPVIYFTQHLTKNSGFVVWKIMTLLAILACGMLLYRVDNHIQRIGQRTVTFIVGHENQKAPKIYSIGYEEAKASANHSSHAWKRGEVIAILAVVTIGLSTAQSIWHDTHVGKSDSARLERQLKESQKQLDESHKLANEAAPGNSQTPDGTGSVSSSSQTATPANQVSVTAIGDSVMLGASGILSQDIPGIYVDAAQSRQVKDAPDVINQLKASGVLGQTVILHLGTNGPFQQETGQAVLDAIGSDHKIYWINAYGANLTWQGDVNTAIQQLAQVNPNVTVIDWASYAAGHTDWFYHDGIHLTVAGQQAYAAFVKQAVGL